MPEYRRVKEPGGMYFFTVVTYDRKPILTSPQSRAILRIVWKKVQTSHLFETLAICLLPDHLHTIWKLPEGDIDYPLRWNEIKRHFTHEYLDQVERGGERNVSRKKGWNSQYGNGDIGSIRFMMRKI